MNSQISQISEIMEDIKEKISDNEYKIIMDNLMKIHNNNYNNNNTIQLRELPNRRNGQLTEEQIEGIEILQLRLKERIRRDGIESRRMTSGRMTEEQLII